MQTSSVLACRNSRVGDLTAGDREIVMTAAADALREGFDGEALETHLKNVEAWRDRIASERIRGAALAYEFGELTIDEMVLKSGVASVTGSYVITEKQGFGLPDGRLATYGGTYTNGFIATVSTSPTGWRVITFDVEPRDFVPNRGCRVELQCRSEPLRDQASGRGIVDPLCSASSHSVSR